MFHSIIILYYMYTLTSPTINYGIVYYSIDYVVNLSKSK